MTYHNRCTTRNLRKGVSPHADWTQSYRRQCKKAADPIQFSILPVQPDSKSVHDCRYADRPVGQRSCRKFGSRHWRRDCICIYIFDNRFRLRRNRLNIPICRSAARGGCRADDRNLADFVCLSRRLYDCRHVHCRPPLPDSAQNSRRVL